MKTLIIRATVPDDFDPSAIGHSSIPDALEAICGGTLAGAEVHPSEPLLFSMSRTQWKLLKYAIRKGLMRMNDQDLMEVAGDVKRLKRELDAQARNA